MCRDKSRGVEKRDSEIEEIYKGRIERREVQIRDREGVERNIDSHKIQPSIKNRPLIYRV